MTVGILDAGFKVEIWFYRTVTNPPRISMVSFVRISCLSIPASCQDTDVPYNVLG